VMGVYPMQDDETCWFLAVDFDKSTWMDDVVRSCRPAVAWGCRGGRAFTLGQRARLVFFTTP
jgi:hypothetical protein